jgi:transcriptional regulator GlxA family with amidase domain
LDGFDFAVFWAAIEPFVAANTLSRRELYRWVRLSLDGRPVQDAAAEYLAVDDALGRRPDLDLIVCLGPEPPDNLLAVRPALRSRVILAAAADPREAFDHSLELVDREHGQTLASEVEDWRLRLHTPGDAGRGRGGLLDRFAVRDERLLRAIAFITAWANEGPQTEDIAKAAGLSTKKLQAGLKANLGMAPQELVLETRLKRAQRLLQETSMPVDKVGRTCGFKQRATFDRCYRRRFGRSPNRERQSATPGAPRRRQPGEDSGTT